MVKVFLLELDRIIQDLRKVDDKHMNLTIISIASAIVWIAAIYELLKPSEKQNNRRIITLTSFGTLSTLVITISLVQSLFL